MATCTRRATVQEEGQANKGERQRNPGKQRNGPRRQRRLAGASGVGAAGNGRRRQPPPAAAGGGGGRRRRRGSSGYVHTDFSWPSRRSSFRAATVKATGRTTVQLRGLTRPPFLVGMRRPTLAKRREDRHDDGHDGDHEASQRALRLRCGNATT